MKSIYTFVILFIFASVFSISCEKESYCDVQSPDIFKFKEGKDYSNHLFVNLSKDKKRMIGYSTFNNEVSDWLIDTFYHYYKGYYFLKSNYGVNTAYLSLTYDEAEKINSLSFDSIERLIIDRNPYEEYYYDEENYLAYGAGEDNYWLKKSDKCSGCYDTIWHVYDTSKFHRLVDNNELEKYLTRVK